MDVITDGLKHDGGKPRLSLVPGEAIEAIGAVMTHGAEKYGQASYKQVAPERYRDALMRHVCKWLKDPHGKDEDSGLPHLWHIITNAAFLCELDTFYVARSNINLAKEEVETFKDKDIIVKPSLNAAYRMTSTGEWKELTTTELAARINELLITNEWLDREE